MQIQKHTPLKIHDVPPACSMFDELPLHTCRHQKNNLVTGIMFERISIWKKCWKTDQLHCTDLILETDYEFMTVFLLTLKLYWLQTDCRFEQTVGYCFCCLFVYWVRGRQIKIFFFILLFQSLNMFWLIVVFCYMDNFECYHGQRK